MWNFLAWAIFRELLPPTTYSKPPWTDFVATMSLADDLMNGLLCLNGKETKPGVLITSEEYKRMLQKPCTWTQ